MSTRSFISAALVVAAVLTPYAAGLRACEPCPCGKEKNSQAKSEKEREIERKLLSPVNLSFCDTPLRKVLEDLRSWQGINIVPDEPALQEEGITLDRPVTMKLEGISLKSALGLILHQVGLTYVVKDEVLQITTPRHAQGRLQQQVYPVADLVVPIGDAGSVWNPVPKLVACQPAPASGSPVGTAGPSSSTTSRETLEEQLVMLIKSAVAPKSWNDQGGPGTIDYFPLTMALVINQTADIQEQVVHLLDALRRLQDVQVVVEMRVVSVSDKFMERAGLDFPVQKADAPAPCPKPPSPPPCPGVPAFAPCGVLPPPPASPGCSPPAGPVHIYSRAVGASGACLERIGVDFDIVLPEPRAGRAKSGTPPCCASGPAGASKDCCPPAKVRYLDDNQVRHLIETAQGDQRTNVLQAPKITTLNGQCATINTMDQQQYVTGVNVRWNGEQVMAIPQSEAIATGLEMTLQPVVAADQRSVRLNLKGCLTEIDSATVPLSPVKLQTMINACSDTGAPAEPVLFTQFIQTPRLSKLSVEETLHIPEGKTALVYGGRRTCERRQECAHPVMGKVPCVGRLFRHVSCGRETEHVLIMVTPKIVICPEQEAVRPAVRAAPAMMPAPRPAVHAAPAAIPMASPAVHPAPVPMPWAPIPMMAPGVPVACPPVPFAAVPLPPPVRRTAAVEKLAPPSPLKKVSADPLAGAARWKEKKVAKLMDKYQQACADGRLDEARAIAAKALVLDPACFSNDR